MELVDKRGTALTTTFDDLVIGDCYQDEEGNICIKIGYERCLYINANGDWDTALERSDELIIPLKATLTVERKA